MAFVWRHFISANRVAQRASMKDRFKGQVRVLRQMRSAASCIVSGLRPTPLVDAKLALAFGAAFATLASANKASFASCSADRVDAQGSWTTVLRVEGMGCQGCVSRVKGALEAVPNAASARVDLESKLAWVIGSASAEELAAAVKSAGKTGTLVGSSAADGFVEMTAANLKESLAASGCSGLVLDIDETLSATNVAWFQRLADLFGNPDGAPVSELINKYHLAQHVPFWQSPEALAWMQSQRDDPRAQDGLPLIPGAVEGTHALKKVVPIVGYCTVRPSSVNQNTIAWLRENGFPGLPVVAKPTEIPFADGNKWKAAVLNELWPQVTGIVDDNPKVAFFAGASYPGKILLFGHRTCPPGVGHAIPCPTWPLVVAVAAAGASVLN